MDLAELRDKVSFWVGFNAGSPGQDFDGGSVAPWKRVDDAINMAIRDEYRRAVNECGAEAFWNTVTVTWPASQLELNLPSNIHRADIITILDMTDYARGLPLVVGGRTSYATVVWKDRDTLMWLTEGPGSARAIDIEHLARPAPLVNATDKPDLFPEDHHDLMVWSAAILLKQLGDEEAPAPWERNQYDQRLQLHKYLSNHSPRTASPVDVSTYHEGGE